MAVYDFFGITMEIDKNVTASWYKSASKWGCRCQYCRNFLMFAEQRNLPPQVLEVLERIGIPPEKATYVGKLYSADHGYCYQFSYRVAGNIPGNTQNRSVQYDWGAGGYTNEPYPYGAPDFPGPHFDLEFFVILPWVLDEPESS